jgi:hypothetical protein
MHGEATWMERLRKVDAIVRGRRTINRGIFVRLSPVEVACDVNINEKPTAMDSKTHPSL